jgi:hypothetical protein
MAAIRLLVREITSDLRCYTLVAAITATSIKACFLVQEIYARETCAGLLHTLWYAIVGVLRSSNCCS